MDEQLEAAYEGRRYSAIAVRHSELRSLRDLTAKTDGLVLEPVLKPGSRTRPALHRADWRRPNNLYPSGSLLRGGSQPTGSDRLFSHRCFIAEVPLQPADSPIFVFASPHIRVVGAWATRLGSVLQNPRPEYAAPLLDPLFEALRQTATQFRATQITLQMSGIDVQTVALTGKSPLISSLRATLKEVARPYAVRLEVPREERPLKLHMDRHGNYWWYQANADAFGIAVGALATLATANYMTWTRDLPHRRTGSDEVLDGE